VNALLTNWSKRVSVHGLRPTPISLGKTSPWTHGVEIELARVGQPCNRIRWLQTVKNRNNPVPHTPAEFVDLGGNYLPWYHSGANPAPTIFTDTPCAPAPSVSGRGLEFFATASVAVWTMDRVTLVKSFTYGFSVHTGDTPAAIWWNPAPRSATSFEVREQIRILRAGINQLRAPTGGTLNYRTAPANGTLNEGALVGHF
jgi:hypothetical protein